MKIPKITALMPMKGHSERVPRKNIRPLCGRPMFHWMMDALVGARHVAQIVVNTDSPEIGQGVEQFGGTYHVRPAHLLGDMVPMNPLIEDDLGRLEGEWFLQTHSTNPLLTSATIDRAIEEFFDTQGDSDSLFTVTTFHTRFYWPDGTAINHDPKRMVRSQDLPPIYEENSCLYLFSRASFAANGHRIGARPKLFALDPLEAVDIDEEWQFTMAESLMERRLATGPGRKA